MPRPGLKGFEPACLATLIRTVLLVSLLVCASQSGADTDRILFSRGIDCAPADEADIGKRQLDVAYAENEVRPLVVFVHGGGWRRGSRLAGRQLQDTLLSAGFTVASVDYRLWPSVDVQESAADVARAVRYLHDNAGRFNLDPDRTALIGHSAGAHIVALVIMHPAMTEMSGLLRDRVSSVVLLDSHGLDVMSYVTDRPNLAEIFGKDPAERASVSPVHLLNHSPPDYLPAFAIAWNSDREPTSVQSLLILEALNAVGANITALPYTKKPHRAFLTDFRDPGLDLSQRIVSFLHTTLD